MSSALCSHTDNAPTSLLKLGTRSVPPPPLEIMTRKSKLAALRVLYSNSLNQIEMEQKRRLRNHFVSRNKEVED